MSKIVHNLRILVVLVVHYLAPTVMGGINFMNLQYYMVYTMGHGAEEIYIIARLMLVI